MKKQLHFLAIGSELVSGEITEINGHWLAKWLTDKGLELCSITAIADDQQFINKYLENFNFSNSQLVISGGLGPTKDDKTKLIVSEFFSHDLIKSSKALELASAQYQRAKKVYSETGYGLIPKSWTPLSNPIGLAPGLKHPDSCLMLLPGVPREFQSMIKEHLLGLLDYKASSDTEAHLKQHARLFGLSEEKIFFEIAPTLWEELSVYGNVSCLPKFPRVDIGLTRTPGKPALPAELFRELINKHLGNYHPDFEKQPLETKLVEVLKKRHLSISTAESCTGGLCSHLLTQVSGSSQVFQAGFVCYSQQAKIKILNVSASDIQSYTVYSHQVVEQMAHNLCLKTGCDIGISTSGIAGPGGATKENPVGSVYIGISFKGVTKTYRREFTGDRETLKERFAYWALLLTYQQILFS